MPTLPDLKAAARAIGRGTVIGSLLGILPAAPSSRRSPPTLWKNECRRTRAVRAWRHRRWGARAPTAPPRNLFIPLLTLGIRRSGDGADSRRHDHPRHRAGPAGRGQAAGLFWGMIASMWIGNLMLIVINLPLVGMWVRPARAVPPPVDDRHLLLHRRVFAQQRAVRRVATAIFGVRLLAGEARLRAGADDPGLRARPMMEETSPRHADRSRRRRVLTRPISATCSRSLFLLVLAVLPSLRAKAKRCSPGSGDTCDGAPAPGRAKTCPGLSYAPQAEDISVETWGASMSSFRFPAAL
jgi:putative tricarboxylic transport membrane protein